MAYVDRSTSSDDDAQVIILAGFLVALGILVLAVYLNGLIFAQDLSTRDDGVSDRKIKGIERDLTTAAHETAGTVGHNPSGDVTNSDLFDADSDDATDNFEQAMEAYGENATRSLETRSAVGEVPGVEVDAEDSWVVGQEEGEFQNASGDDPFQVATDTGNQPVEEVTLYIEDPFPSGLSDESFRITAQEDTPGNPPPHAASTGTLWEMTFENSGLFGDKGINVTRNTTSKSNSWINDSEVQDADNITVELNPEDDEACLRVDMGECDDSYESALHPDWLDDDVESISIRNEENREGSYNLVLDPSEVEADEIAVCDPDAPCVQEPSGSFDVYAVNAVTEAEFDYEYSDAQVDDYEITVEEGVESQDDLLLDEVEP